MQPPEDLPPVRSVLTLPHFVQVASDTDAGSRPAARPSVLHLPAAAADPTGGGGGGIGPPDDRPPPPPRRRRKRGRGGPSCTAAASFRGRVCHLLTHSGGTDDATEASGDRRDATDVPAEVCLCRITFPRDVGSVALASERCTSGCGSTGGGGIAVLLVATRDGRLYRSSPGECVAWAEGTVGTCGGGEDGPFRMVQCDRSASTGTMQRRAGAPLPLGTDMLSVLKDDGADRDTANPNKSTGDGGTLLVAAGSSSLSPPVVAFIPDGMRANEKTGTGKDEAHPIYAEEIPGLARVDSRIASVLFVSRNAIGEAAWRNLASSGGRGTIPGEGFDADSAVLLGTDDGSVYCSLISSTVRPKDGGDAAEDLPTLKVGGAVPIYSLRPRQSVASLILVPTPSVTDDAGPRWLLVCVGCLGTVSVLDSMLTSGSPFLPVSGGLPRIGVWTSAAPLPCAGAASVVKGSVCEPRAALVATCDDGSAYVCCLNIEEEDKPRKREGLASFVAKLPMRKEMASVSACLARKVGRVSIHFSTFRGALAVMEMRGHSGISLNGAAYRSEGYASDVISTTRRGVLRAITVSEGDVNDVPADGGLHSSTTKSRTEAMLRQLAQLTSRGRPLTIKGEKMKSDLQSRQSSTRMSRDDDSSINNSMRETRHVERVVSVVSFSPSTKGVSSDNFRKKSGKSADNPAIEMRLNDDGENGISIIGRLGVRYSSTISKSSSAAHEGGRWVQSCHVQQSLPAPHPPALRARSLDDLAPLCHRPHLCRQWHSSTREDDQSNATKIVYAGSTVTQSASVSRPETQLQCSVPLWDRYPLLSDMSLSTTYDHICTGDGHIPWSQSTAIVRRGKKRNRGTGTAVAFPSASAKRARFARVVADRKYESESGVLGIVLPLKTAGDEDGIRWDILDGVLYSCDEGKLDVNDTGQANIMAEALVRARKSPAMRVETIPFPENRLIDTFTSSAREPNEECYKSRSIMLAPSSSLSKQLFPNGTSSMVAGPHMGLNAVSIVAATNKNVSSEGTAVEDSRLGFAVSAKLYPDDVHTTLPLLRSAIVRRVADRFGCSVDATVSELEAANLLDMYQKSLKGVRTKKMTRYLKRRADELIAESDEKSAGGQGKPSSPTGQSTLRLYHQLRTLAISLG